VLLTADFGSSGVEEDLFAMGGNGHRTLFHSESVTGRAIGQDREVTKISRRDPGPQSRRRTRWRGIRVRSGFHTTTGGPRDGSVGRDHEPDGLTSTSFVHKSGKTVAREGPYTQGQSTASTGRKKKKNICGVVVTKHSTSK